MYIEEKIISNAIIRGGIHYYIYEDAFRLIELCEVNKIQVLGIDSFTISSNQTVPHMEHSIDLSNDPDAYNKAKAFLKSKELFDFLFEIVYGDKSL